MIDFIGDFGMFLVCVSICGIILCGLGYIIEKIIPTDKIEKFFSDNSDEE